jgi:hypothetical protein
MARLALGLDRAGFVHRLADHVHDAAERFVTHRHRDRRAGVGDVLAAHQAFGRVHGDGANGVFAQVLRNFQHQPVTAIVGFQRVEDFRQVTSSNCTSTTAPMTWDACPAPDWQLPFGRLAVTLAAGFLAAAGVFFAAAGHWLPGSCLEPCMTYLRALRRPK